MIQRASFPGQGALGERAGKRARRVQVLDGEEFALPPRCASLAGYRLHAGVGFEATDRSGLERLCRYILRPPSAMDRLQRREDGSVVVGLERVWSDGTSALVFAQSDLVVALVALTSARRGSSTASGSEAQRAAIARVGSTIPRDPAYVPPSPRAG